MDRAAYERLEAGGKWSGNDRQAAALAALMDLPLPALIRFTGRDGTLADLLTSAATTRWQAYVRPVGKVVPLPKARLQGILQELHSEYQATMTATLNWSGSGSAEESGRAGRAFLDGILAEFWARAGERHPHETPPSAPRSRVIPETPRRPQGGRPSVQRMTPGAVMALPAGAAFGPCGRGPSRPVHSRMRTSHFPSLLQEFPVPHAAAFPGFPGSPAPLAPTPPSPPAPRI